jgi:hypothetical protein
LLRLAGRGEGQRGSEIHRETKNEGKQKEQERNEGGLPRDWLGLMMFFTERKRGQLRLKATICGRGKQKDRKEH